MKGLPLAALLFTATAAVAQIPSPDTGWGGFYFAAFDGSRSYTVYLDVRYNANGDLPEGTPFDPTVPGQSFELPNFDGFFADLGQIEWSVVAADSTAAPGSFQGQGFYTTGTAQGLNGPAINTLTGAVRAYVNTGPNIVCADTPECLVTDTGSNAYAGNIADLQSPQQIDNGALFGEEIGMVLVTQAQNPAAFNLEELPFTWLLNEEGLFYGPGEVVIPVPAAFWLMLTGTLGLLRFRRRG